MTALVWKEARLLLGTVALWIGVLLAVVLCEVWSRAEAPTWTAWTSNSGMASLILAGFFVIVGHLVASRDHRHGASEAMAVLPAPVRRRSTALLAIVPVAGLLGALTLGAQLMLLTSQWPSGRVDPWALPVAVVIPMVGAGLGLAVGRWLPATAAGPLALFACAAVLAILPVFGSTSHDLSWVMFPVVLTADATTTGWHLTYLAGLLAAVVGVVLLRHWRIRAALLVLLALGGSVLAVHQQLSA
ncbi:hypothetical protein [Actinoplanes sp. N902-109]|uniref:hypothetical protein n=1 Tax=Actinoplanes sp. (strain N902-109) TaxID=649831 RepID=UPI000329551B|nr:hypothetical protein [Actinoplanes sp. N902-109]AGL13540.1 hypothetical protein L083_0030 [Actinoplanes sp. N902-109]